MTKVSLIKPVRAFFAKAAGLRKPVKADESRKEFAK
jgi:hypothetical protein